MPSGRRSENCTNHPALPHHQIPDHGDGVVDAALTLRVRGARAYGKVTEQVIEVSEEWRPWDPGRGGRSRSGREHIREMAGPASGRACGCWPAWGWGSPALAGVLSDRRAAIAKRTVRSSLAGLSLGTGRRGCTPHWPVASGPSCRALVPCPKVSGAPVLAALEPDPPTSAGPRPRVKSHPSSEHVHLPSFCTPCDMLLEGSLCAGPGPGAG